MTAPEVHPDATVDVAALREALAGATNIRRSLPGELHGGPEAEYSEVFIEEAFAHHAPGPTHDPDLREIWRADAHLIALAVNALPALLDEVEAGRRMRAADPFVTISTALDAKRPDLAGTELQMWRHVTKVCEESGEVWRALSGYVAENPRKGQTHTLDDLRGELLDTASAALCAVAHLDSNEGDPLSALIDHATATADRLACAIATGGAS